MAITVTKLTSHLTPVYAGVTSEGVLGCAINLGTPYATGGIAIAAADVTAAAGATCTTIKAVVPGVSADGTLNIIWDSGNSKFIAQNQAGNEIANATNLSAATKTFHCIITYV